MNSSLYNVESQLMISTLSVKNIKYWSIKIKYCKINMHSFNTRLLLQNIITLTFTLQLKTLIWELKLFNPFMYQLFVLFCLFDRLLNLTDDLLILEND